MVERYPIKYEEEVLGYWLINKNERALIEMTNEDREKLNSLPSRLELNIHGESISVGEFRKDYLPNLEVVEPSIENSD